MDRRYQVFVSSTYRDLVEERREVIQALLEMDCIPAGMELFPAANEDQWSLIKTVIDDCDYYVVIVGGRYGSISKEGISYTEQEYDYTLETGKPVLGFVHENPSEIPAGKSEMDQEAQEKLETFRQKVQQKLVRQYRSPEQLGSLVSRSLIRLIKSAPAEGWIRGRFAITPEREQELSHLKARVAELELELERSTHSSQPFPIDANLQHGSDETVIEWKLIVGNHYYGQEEYPGRQTKISWDDIFAIIGPSLIDENTEQVMRHRLARRFLTSDVEEFAHNSRIVQQSPGRQVPIEIILDTESFDRIKVQLRALQLIEKGKKKRGVLDKDIYWRLTDFGDQYLTTLIAARRDALSE